MKNLRVIGLLGAVAWFAGCTIETPPDAIYYGTPCPGVERVMDGGDCENNNNCSAFQKSFELGRCPKDYNVCVPAEESSDNKPYCMKCDLTKNYAVCNGQCINSDSDNEFCGAKGMCSDKRASDGDYAGDNCIEKSDETTRYTCKSGTCQKTDCEIGQHEKYDEDQQKLVCVPDTNEKCGSEYNECTGSTWCNRGKCVEGCSAGQVFCGGDCRDPLHNPEFCGAKINDAGECEYKACEEGEICDNGSCVLHSCKNSNEMRCPADGGTEECIDVMSDVNNCGNCAKRCANLAPKNSEVVECQEGECKFECLAGFETCNTESGMECADITREYYNCGSCGHQCGEKQVCNNKVCEDNPCEGEYECYIGNSCEKNKPKSCGKTCVDCFSTLNASDATCDDVGECHVNKCAADYHLAGTAGNYSCEPNTKTSCGSIDKVDAKNCNDVLDNASSVDCISGVCKVDKCKSGFHKYDAKNECEANDNTNCGSHGNPCDVENGVANCTASGKCEIDHCNKGYHQESNSCVKDNVDTCGGKVCKNEITGWQYGDCENAECVVKGCQKHYHLNGNSCEVNSVDNCKGHGNSYKCYYSGAKSYECDDDDGCLVKECNANYHITSGFKGCESNSDTKCGIPTSTVTQNCNYYKPGWKEGTCNSSTGTCSFKKCQDGLTRLGQTDLCIQPCYYAYYGSSSYCCPNSSAQNQCQNYDEWHDCGQCDSVNFDSSWSDYDNCITKKMWNEVGPANTDYYMDIYCDSSTCSEFQYGGTEYLLDDLPYCYYKYYY